MINKIVAELKYQQPEVTVESITKIQKIYKASAISEFQDTILLTTLYLIQRANTFSFAEAQDYLIRQIRNPLVTEFIESIEEIPSKLTLELETCTAPQLLTYILFADPDTKKGPDFNSGSSINKLLALLPNEDESVFDWGFGYGQTLLYAALYGNARKLRGIENNLPCYLVTKLRLSLLPDTTNIKLDFDNMFHRKVYSNHFVADHLGFKNTAIIKPLPGKNAADFTADEWILVPAQLNVFKELMSPATFKSEWPYIITALASLISSQRLYAITTNGAASTETYSDIRKRLIKFGYVECVVQLPENLIPGTSIPTTLWIFSKNNKTVRFIDASEIKTKGRRKFSLSDKDIKAIVALITKPEFTESNHSHKSQKGRIKVVHNDELAASNYNLAPSRYIQEDFPSDSSGFILLEEVCQINRGVLLKAQELDTLVADNNSVKYITPKNLNNSIIDLSGVTSLAETDEISPKKAISDNNIIMSKLLPFKAGYITDTQNNMIFSNGNTYYLQVDKKAINPLFLFMYLNSKMAQKQLEQLSRGSSTTTLSISDLKNLKIPLIKRSIQNELSEKYQELLAKEQRIYESLKALERDKDRLIEDALQ